MTKTMKRSYKLQQTLKSVGKSAEKITYFFTQTQNKLVPLLYQLLNTSCWKQHKLLSSAQLYCTQNICTMCHQGVLSVGWRGENWAVYEVMWKKEVEINRQATGDNIIGRVCFAYWIVKAINTHSEYVILIAFPLQQWLHEHCSMLQYMYIACFVVFCIGRKEW
jgi:hypothetical protein